MSQSPARHTAPSPASWSQAEAQAAISAAEAERSTRAEAEGMSESLRADAERRARVFNNAVKAAVSKVQRELEAERDELQVRMGQAMQERPVTFPALVPFSVAVAPYAPEP